MSVKYSSNNLKLVIVLAATIFAIILLQSIFEYNMSHKAVMDLMGNHASSLLLSVTRASEKGLVAYEILQDKISQYLFAAAEAEVQLDKVGALSDAQLREALNRNRLQFIQVINSSGETFMTANNNSNNYQPPLDSSLISVLLAEKDDRVRLGFIGSDLAGQRSFAVGVRRDRGGAVVVGIDASELLTMRRSFGTGSVIEDLSQSPGVKYAAIMLSGTILASSRSFPRDSLDFWYLPDSSSTMSIRTRTRKIGDNSPVFEAVGPFMVAGERYGEIIVGIDTAYLQLLTANLRQDIIWRSILFLIIAVAAVTTVMLRQNNRFMSGRLEQMKTDVMRLEADRTLNAKLAAMGELAGGVAHEIRNPLNAIGVIIQRLQREFTPKMDEAEYKELTSLIKSESDRIDESIKHFLTLAKPPVLHRSLTDINEIIKNVVSLFQPRAGNKGCVLNLDLSELPPVNVDANLLHQAILNLLENALAAVADNGVINIRTSRENRLCCIGISDNGPGIPEALKERVFDLYYTTKATGTGMGLPTVLMIIKEHGGRIVILDNPLGGATFRLEIPIE